MRLLFELRSLVEGAVWGFIYLNFFFFYQQRCFFKEEKNKEQQTP